MISRSQVPEFEGIFPGVTTREELVASLGEPDHREFNLFNWTTTFIYEYDFRYFINNVEFHRKVSNQYILRNGIVRVIERDLHVGGVLGELPSPEQFFEIYGAPEEVTWSKLEPPKWSILYCEQGIIAFGNRNFIAYIYYFVPTTLSECIHQFRSVVSETNPYAGSDLIMSKDPWGFSD